MSHASARSHPLWTSASRTTKGSALIDGSPLFSAPEPVRTYATTPASRLPATTNPFRAPDFGPEDDYSDTTAADPGDGEQLRDPFTPSA
ncbi:hypothetical protein OHS33_32920 [Streptomyces sp. NBC_00536]|uniref:hypothetical protein n=1 Tax=Streptomyces sp. NBC_00536 TaxID=2975769 RepID=UPI002E806EF6|nr:hypothetical protein [Streptomyces sp. NBC_00536]WUC82746.1 hypothetical protein OHS33_32920 [Streptomyces sp. NBC_00536]